MCIDVGCCADIAMPKPFRHSFEICTILYHDACCRMPQIMKADMRLSIDLQGLMELVRYKAPTRPRTVLPAKDIPAGMTAAPCGAFISSYAGSIASTSATYSSSDKICFQVAIIPSPSPFLPGFYQFWEHYNTVFQSCQLLSETFFLPAVFALPFKACIIRAAHRTASPGSGQSGSCHPPAHGPPARASASGTRSETSRRTRLFLSAGDARKRNPYF